MKKFSGPFFKNKVLFSVLILSVAFLSGCSVFKKKHPVKANQQISEKVIAEKPFCSSAREYVTSYEFLKTKKYFKAQWGRKVAEKVAMGCEGAAKRFIRGYSLLEKSGILVDDSAQLAIKMAQSTDEKSETFMEVFQKSFLKEYLDLSLQSSIELASGLAFEYDGLSKVAQEDFAQLVKFCISTKKLDLSKPNCAQMAYRLSMLGQNSKKGIYASFIKAFDFVKSKKGPAQPTGQALAWAERLIKVSPKAVDNFIKAFEYGISKEGMGLSVAQSLDFADSLGKINRSLASDPSKSH